MRERKAFSLSRGKDREGGGQREWPLWLSGIAREKGGVGDLQKNSIEL